uniref:PH domain-containing protein n=1 Tax=Chrysotila carterae TaxID=13221 RepID=A0A7S4BD53_CHRCT
MYSPALTIPPQSRLADRTSSSRLPFLMLSSRTKNLQDEDAALNFELPWKGCVNVAYATMQLSPPEASNNPCVIQLRTPLRTIYLKAKHELDAEDWLAQLSAAQRGIPLKQRKAKLRKFDVLTDELAVKLEAGSIILAADLLHNPVGLHYAATHCDASGDKLLAPLLSIVLDDDNYRTTTAADQKLARAKALIGKCATLESIAAEVREETKAKIEAVPPVLNDDLFSPFVKFVTSAYEPHVNNFLNSEEFGALRSNLEEKAVIVKHPDETEEVFELSPKTVIGRGVNVSESGGLNLCKDLKVSREHALFAAGKLAVVVRDLGSYRGTHFESGQKILEEVIFPGQTIVVGDTKLTYQLRPPSPSKRKSRSSVFFSKLRPGS